jgi:hypothetical protein
MRHLSTRITRAARHSRAFDENTRDHAFARD